MVFVNRTVRAKLVLTVYCVRFEKISGTTFINCLQTGFPLWPVYRMICGGEPASTDYNIVLCWWFSSVLNQENRRNIPARGVHTSARHTFTEFIIQQWKHVARRREIVRRNDWLPQKYSSCACLGGGATVAVAVAGQWQRVGRTGRPWPVNTQYPVHYRLATLYLCAETTPTITESRWKYRADRFLTNTSCLCNVSVSTLRGTFSFSPTPLLGT